AITDNDQRYLDALVKEILRIRSPVTVAAARQPIEPFEIDGYEIPSEVTVIINGEGVHHDPGVHSDPECLKPERFLEPTPDYSFLVLGGGARRCIGAALAQLEMRVFIPGLLSRFDLVPVGENPPARVRRGITLVPKGGGRVRLAAYAPVQPSSLP